MHFLETYALNCGLKIDKPYIFQKYYPAPAEKYITFSYSSYEYYQDVIDIIHPSLESRGIEIIYIKNKNEEKFDLCHEIVDIDYNQCAHLMENSLLHFGEPTISSDLASHYNIKTVTIYSNAFPQNVRPYWNQENDFEVKADAPPAFDIKENYPIVNSIKPEEIAKNILTALNIEYDYKYETIYLGEFYYSNDIAMEIVPDDNPPIMMDNSNCSIRMDLNFNEEYLYNLLKIKAHQIWTDKPVNKEILKVLKDQIQQVFYIITKEGEPSFIKTLNELSIKYKLVSFLEEEELNSQKLNYIDFDPIIDLKSNAIKESEVFKNFKINSLFYSSCKVIYDNGLFYPTEYARENMMAIDKPFKTCKFEESDVLFKDLPFLKVLHELD